MRVLKIILLILVVAIAAVFTIQNIQVVRLSFLNVHLEVPLSLASIAIYVLGAISGGLLFSFLKNLADNVTRRRDAK